MFNRKTRQQIVDYQLKGKLSIIKELIINCYRIESVPNGMRSPDNNKRVGGQRRDRHREFLQDKGTTPMSYLRGCP